MEERVEDDHSDIFRKLCQCRRKTLTKGNEGIVECVAKKQLEFIKRVYNISLVISCV